ncbi:WXG100 family type VII secretion target [Kitasatospora sp. NPDC058965]|uniref:WXG100-like domain-containing protein n=1 Tax=Kitasatospora sp. NPDC058965 TaxID=3346682 RepID=UPI00367D817C
MAIELPDEVVSMLQFIGVNWPQVNEDKVREFATHVRTFATNVHETHQDSTATVKQLSEVYQGASYDALIRRWSELSNSHMNDLVTACHAVADALDVAAGVIVGMKLQAIEELTLMAITFVADQAAAVATFGLAEAGLLLLEEAATGVVNYLEQQLEQYIIGQVIEAAITPLAEVVGNAVSGLVYKGAEAAMGLPDDGGTPTHFSIHPQAMLVHADTMHGHAETVAAHAEDLRGKLAQVDFS